MKLSQARYIYQRAQEVPLMQIKCIEPEGEGRFETGNWQMIFDGHAYNEYYITGWLDEPGRYYVGHCVYGNNYAEGDSPKAAMLAFAKKLKWLPEIAKKRKLATRAVEKYGIGPIITQEGSTYIATLNGEVVGKAANYNAAMKIGLRAEKEMQNV